MKILLVLWGIIVLVLLFYRAPKPEIESPPTINYFEVTIEDVDTHITWAYEVPEGTIMSDLVVLAGIDEDYVYIITEDKVYQDEQIKVKKKMEAQFDLNRASVDMLDNVEGIGETRAQKLYDYLVITPFSSWDEVKKIGELNDSTLLSLMASAFIN